jgi:hypothetical protein
MLGWVAPKDFATDLGIREGCFDDVDEQLKQRQAEPHAAFPAMPDRDGLESV